MTHRYQTPTRKRDSVNPRWTPPKNGHEVPPGHAWGAITCVAADYDPRHLPRQEPEVRLPRGFWVPLLRELALRLEMTARDQLRVPFANVELARRAYFALTTAFRYRAISVTVRTGYHETPPALYVSRGPAWKKHPVYDTD